MVSQDMKDAFKLSSTGDAWGDVMGALFDICNTLHREGYGTPAHWEYTPGALGPYPIDEQALDWSEFTADELEEFGELLLRCRSILKAQGRDY